MPYRRGTYDFVVDSSFTPFSMQEMLVPLTAYKEAFEKDEAAYQDLTDRADVFKDLSKSLPEGSEARKIYEGYANDLKAQAEDFSQNGLSMSNRSALRRLKRRYQGEIGMLDKASKALEAEKALRRQMVAKDPSMLYAVAPEDLNIDQFIGGKTPSLYGISGTDLYTKAAAASQAMSKRQFSVNGENKTLGGYYYDYVQRMGYTPEDLRKFGNQISADFAAQVSTLPELQQAANQILEANGVNENLTGNNLRKAQQQVIRGLIDGAVYSEQHNPQRDLGTPTWAEKAADTRAKDSLAETKRQHNNQLMMAGFDENGMYHPEYLGEIGTTQSGSPVYLDKNKKPFAYGSDGKTKFYDNDGDGNFTDTYPSSRKPTTGSTNTPKEPLKTNVVYDKNGNVSPVKTGQNAPTWGRKALSFDEAVQINPYIKDHHPGYEKDYDYYINGNSVTIIAHGKTADATQQDSSDDAY